MSGIPSIDELLNARVEALVAERVEALLPAELRRAVDDAARRMVDQQVQVVPMRDIRKTLGYRQNRAAIQACGRMGIPVVKLSKRKTVVWMADWTQWLASRREVPAAGKGGE